MEQNRSAPTGGDPTARLFAAIEAGDLDEIERLIHREGVSPNSKQGGSSSSALFKATRYSSSWPIVSALAKAGADVNEIANAKPLIAWASPSAIPILATFGAHANQAFGALGTTPLLDAVKHCFAARSRACAHEEVLRINALLEAGADPDQPDANGVTPLYSAVYRFAAAGAGADAELAPEWTRAVRVLLRSGADANLAEAKQGFAPLHVAASASASAPDCLTEVANELLEAGARTDLRTRDGHTALDIANANPACHRVRELLLRPRHAPMSCKN
jgi:hypothetical protein